MRRAARSAPDISVSEAAVPYQAQDWAQFYPGSPYEANQQVLAYTVSNDHPEIFSSQPAIDVDGTLTFTPADDIDAITVATLNVTVQDDGGTAFGGQDTSAPVMAQITMTPIADTLTVTSTSDAGTGSLRDCLSRARSTDTITFDPGVFSLDNSDAATVINVLSPCRPWCMTRSRSMLRTHGSPSTAPLPDLVTDSI